MIKRYSDLIKNRKSVYFPNSGVCPSLKEALLSRFLLVIFVIVTSIQILGQYCLRSKFRIVLLGSASLEFLENVLSDLSTENGKSTECVNMFYHDVSGLIFFLSGFF